MNNQFDYSNDFSKILELSFYHEFFDDNNFRDLELVPDNETRLLIKNYNLIQRKKGNTFIDSIIAAEVIVQQEEQSQQNKDKK